MTKAAAYDMQLLPELLWPFNFFWGLTPPFNFDGGVL